MTSTNDHKNLSVVEPKYVENYDCLKRIQNTCFTETQGVIGKDRDNSMEPRKIPDQNEKYNKKIKIIKMNQIEIVEQKNSMYEMENETENINRKVEQIEERISEMRIRNLK